MAAIMGVILQLAAVLILMWAFLRAARTLWKDWRIAVVYGAVAGAMVWFLAWMQG